MIIDTQLSLKPNFTSSRQKELDGLIKRGVFEFTKAIDLLTSAQIFNSWFVNKIKLKGTLKAYEKSQLVI